VKYMAVVLAAGRSLRMGAQKLLLPVAGTPMIERVLAACRHLPTAVVGSSDVLAAIDDPNIVRIENTEPERGMVHSLRLANAAIDPSSALVVLLADKPLVTRTLIDLVAGSADGVDICYPIRAGVGGHPVVFSPNARRLVATLADGDSLQALRDDPSLSRRTVETADPGAFVDVDDPEALRGLPLPPSE
jgi:molybdenum cofactor cytidylyltransferase